MQTFSPLSHGSQPTSSAALYYSSLPPTHVAPNFLHIMIQEKVPRVPPHFLARKAGKSAVEQLCHIDDDNWAKWWIEKSGYKHILQKDDNGWTPLHHALDSMTFSPMRAYSAAEALINATPEENLNEQTTGSQPTGFAPLHFA